MGAISYFILPGSTRQLFLHLLLVHNGNRQSGFMNKP